MSRAPIPQLAALLALTFAASLLFGAAGLGFPGGKTAAWLIFTEIRLPRAILGALIGAALGLANGPTPKRR